MANIPCRCRGLSEIGSTRSEFRRKRRIPSSKRQRFRCDGAMRKLIVATLFAGLPAEPAALAQETSPISQGATAFVAPASNEGAMAIKLFTVPPGLKVDLWAAEPMLANPVAFNFDEKGRV